MSELLHELISQSAINTPEAAAISHRDETLNYRELNTRVSHLANSLIRADLKANDRVAVYLPKRFEAVIALFGTSRAGGVFVPVNPLLKAEQASYILQDCNVRILITAYDRTKLLTEHYNQLPDLHTVVIIDSDNKPPLEHSHITFISWNDFTASPDNSSALHIRIDTDMTAILYTSGSTGKPKGVVLSHRNMVAGAKSVAQYLENTAKDRLLAVLPFSFDYGLSQLTTAFHVGASVVLMDYLFPNDVVKMVAKEKITGLAAVPTLWAQIANLEWPEGAIKRLRYITNSGGAMPSATLNALQTALPNTRPILMYGLTEAFRSTWLPPEELNLRPNSIGQAIPNAHVTVVREDGTPCSPGEPGELVHQGSLVAIGYWNDPERTAELFRPAPGQKPGIPAPEIAVWSGDTVQTDEDGFLYFIGRKDDMIKTSGYRVSPTEVEEIIYTSGLVEHVAALGIPHSTLGQAIVVVVTPPAQSSHKENQRTGHVDIDAVITICKKNLPSFMVPASFQVQQTLPRNPNGKIDRKLLASELEDLFQDISTQVQPQNKKDPTE